MPSRRYGGVAEDIIAIIAAPISLRASPKTGCLYQVAGYCATAWVQTSLNENSPKPHRAHPPRVAFEVWQVWRLDAPIATGRRAFHGGHRHDHEVLHFFRVLGIGGRGNRRPAEIGGPQRPPRPRAKGDAPLARARLLVRRVRPMPNPRYQTAAG